MNRSAVIKLVVVCGTVAALVGAPATTPAQGAQEVVRLHFSPDQSTATFRLGTTVQSLLPTTRCEVSTAAAAGPLIKLGSNRKVGLNSAGLGVKSGGAQGTPCGRVDAAETLTLSTLGTSALAGRAMTKLVLDLELKGNAWVKLTLSKNGSQVGPVYGLQSGSSIQPGLTPLPGPPYMATSTPGAPAAACANPSDSGPDSGANDNCRWTVDPQGGEFDTATFTTMIGEFSLEGSADYGGDPDFDTLLFLANQAPSAVDDTLSTDEDVVLNANVLSNDSDADGDSLTVTKINGDPAKVGVPFSLGVVGSVTVASNGTLVFTPTPDASGAANTFTYTISDGNGGAATATVSISVTPVNDPPVATSSSPSVDEDGSVVIPIATDVENDPLTVSCTTPSNGSVVDLGDGSVRYTPDDDYNGSDAFACTASDGPSSSDEVTISVTVNAVNDAPVANDDVAETDEDTAIVIDVLANDTDVDLDGLTVDSVTQGTNGAVTNAGTDVTYTPNAGHVGTDTFTYTASDGNGGTDTATVTVETFQVICSGESVTVTDVDVTGTFTRLGDVFDCKRYDAEASSGSGTVLFQPEGGSTVSYRGVIELGSSPPPTPGVPVDLFLEYDPAGGNTFQPVLWCTAPVFDGAGNVTSATLPPGQTWCIASAYTSPSALGGVDLVTTWQVYGEDDPKFR